MDQTNATPDELQQAINSITNPGAAAADAVATPDLGVPPTPEVPGVAEAPVAVAEPAAVATDDAVAAAVAEATGMPEPAKAAYGDPDLNKVKTMALSDLRPILESVDLPTEKKFKIYKDIIDLTEDKACIEPAYNAAKMITGDKEKAEALLYVVEAIDKLGIPADQSPIA